MSKKLLNRRRPIFKSKEGDIYYKYKNCQITFNEKSNLGKLNIVKENDKLYYHHRVNRIKKPNINVDYEISNQKIKKINLNYPIFPLMRSWENNFHHLVIDVLPLFVLYLELKKEIKNLKLVISNNGLYDFKKEIFSLFGVKENEIITVDILNKRLKTEIWSPLIITADVINKYKNKFMNLVYNTFKIPINLNEKPKRIIIARGKEGQNVFRRCLNSYELYNKLRDELNFKIILMQDYNLKERVEILNNTEYLITELGANCDNIFLMTPINLKKVLIIGNKSIGGWKWHYSKFLKCKNINLEYCYNGVQSDQNKHWKRSTWYIPSIEDIFNKIKDDLQ